jgi:hypothetical protein
MRGKREAMALTIGIPLMVAAMSWAQIAFLSTRGSPPMVVWAAFEFMLLWIIVGLMSGHLVSGFQRRAVGVLVTCLVLTPFLHMLGWVFSVMIGWVIVPLVPGAPRQMLDMGGYYMAIAVMITFVVEDLERSWKQREGERSA